MWGHDRSAGAYKKGRPTRCSPRPGLKNLQRAWFRAPWPQGPPFLSGKFMCLYPPSSPAPPPTQECRNKPKAELLTDKHDGENSSPRETLFCLDGLCHPKLGKELCTTPLEWENAMATCSPSPVTMMHWPMWARLLYTTGAEAINSSKESTSPQYEVGHTIYFRNIFLRLWKFWLFVRSIRSHSHWQVLGRITFQISATSGWMATCQGHEQPHNRNKWLTYKRSKMNPFLLDAFSICKSWRFPFSEWSTRKCVDLVGMHSWDGMWVSSDRSENASTPTSLITGEGVAWVSGMRRLRYRGPRRAEHQDSTMCGWAISMWLANRSVDVSQAKK